MENMQGMKNVCPCSHHKVVPVLVILFGLVFLLGNWGVLSWGVVNFLWPVFVIAGGFTKLMSGKCKCC